MSYQTMYDALRRGGLTEAAALGMLGNWYAESGCEAGRLQGDFSSFRSASKYYTSRVMNGGISRFQFGSDQKGYGLAQWTYVNTTKTAGRKYDLYDFCKAYGTSIDDENMQVQFALYELQHGYAHVLAKLTGCNDIYTATDIICRQFEQPAENNVSARFQYATMIKGQIDLNAWKGGTEPEAETEEPAAERDSEYWPPRMLCDGMKGKDVEVLCAVLKARGYAIHYVTDEFGSFVKDVLVVFQRENGLDHDGIAGPMTWAKLLSI